MRLFLYKKHIRVTDGVEIPEELSVHKTYQSASFPICPDIVERLVAANPGIEIDNELREALANMAMGFAVSEAIKSKKDAAGDPRLSDYQRVAVDWLTSVRRGILADEQGLGKTVESASACAYIPLRWDFRIVVLCTKTKIPDWRDHMNKFFREAQEVKTTDRCVDLTYRRVNGKSIDGMVRIVNYDNAEAIDFSKIDVMIVDEAHKARNRKTHVFTDIKKLARKAEYLFLVTATPKINADQDIWTLLNMCDPARFSSYWSFVFRFFKVTDNGFGMKVEGIKEGEEKRFASIISPYILSRDSSCIDLPGINKILWKYELHPEHHKVYKPMETDWVVSLGRETIDAEVKVAQITRLRQLAISPQILFSEYSGRDKITEIIDIIKRRDKNILVFTFFEEAAEILRDRLHDDGIHSEVLSGKTKKREELLKGFGKDYRILTATFGTGGESLDLTQATCAIFMDLAWHKAGNQHALKRIYRRGQEEDVEIIVVKAENTIEDHIHGIVRQKGEVDAQSIIKEYLKGDA